MTEIRAERLSPGTISRTTAPGERSPRVGHFREARKITRCERDADVARRQSRGGARGRSPPIAPGALP